MGPKSGNIFKETSIGLPDGGDTHADVYPSGATITTRLPGGFGTHDNFDSNGDYIDTTLIIPRKD